MFILQIDPDLATKTRFIFVACVSRSENMRNTMTEFACHLSWHHKIELILKPFSEPTDTKSHFLQTQQQKLISFLLQNVEHAIKHEKHHDRVCLSPFPASKN
jgi:hypothetical protein